MPATPAAPEHVGFRILVIGGETPSSPLRSEELPSAFDIEFAELEKVRDEATREWIASFDALLVDTASIAPSVRKGRIRGILKDLLERDPLTKPIVLVANNDRSTAEVAASAGAWDVAAPKDRCALTARLRAAAACRQFEKEGGADCSTSENGRQMVGTSPAMRAVFSLIRQVGTTEVPVLIDGESGTGKELAALAIHERSHRAGGPFVPINCAAVPEALLESELFGYERGAFTGAVQMRRGVVEAADGGTLFLDEVGELAPGLQSKLLRFLEDHLVERLGGQGKRRHVNVRVIAATNRDLAAAAVGGEFRSDLYYRLAVFELHMPPLRDRAEDVLLMARIFLQRYAREAESDLRGFSSDAIDGLWKWQWPGNVRELINRVRRAVVVAEGPLVSAADLGFQVAPVEAPLLTLREALARTEIECTRRALERSGGNRTEAARLLGISRSTFYELLERHQRE